MIALALVVLAPVTGLGSMPCMEDQRCWNWQTMGNHQRGFLMPNGSRVLVGPNERTAT